MPINFADCLIISIIVLSAVNGYRNGFIASLGKMISVLLAIIAAIFWRNDFIDFLDLKFNIMDRFTELMIQKVPALSLFEKEHFLTFLFNNKENLDPLQQAACFIFQPVSFVVLFLITYLFLMFFFKMLSYVASAGILGSLNRMLGMVITVLQTILIFTIIAGLAIPPLEFAARLDIIGTAELADLMRESLLITYMGEFFEGLTDIIR